MRAVPQDPHCQAVFPAGGVQVAGERDHPGWAQVPGLDRLEAVRLAAVQDQGHAAGGTGRGQNRQHRFVVSSALAHCCILRHFVVHLPTLWRPP
jgi:hypothetical protein